MEAWKTLLYKFLDLRDFKGACTPQALNLWKQWSLFCRWGNRVLANWNTLPNVTLLVIGKTGNHWGDLRNWDHFQATWSPTATRRAQCACAAKNKLWHFTTGPLSLCAGLSFLGLPGIGAHLLYPSASFCFSRLSDLSFQWATSLVCWITNLFKIGVLV